MKVRYTMSIDNKTNKNNNWESSKTSNTPYFVRLFGCRPINMDWREERATLLIGVGSDGQVKSAIQYSPDVEREVNLWSSESASILAYHIFLKHGIFVPMKEQELREFADYTFEGIVINEKTKFGVSNDAVLEYIDNYEKLPYQPHTD